SGRRSPGNRGTIRRPPLGLRPRLVARCFEWVIIGNFLLLFLARFSRRWRMGIRRRGWQNQGGSVNSMITDRGTAMSERAIFIEALEKDDPAKRAAFLDQACAGDRPLRQRIERLLKA